MADNKHYDVIIIGGSYAGLSAGMALGRALRKVLIIDSGQPCNRQTPHSHNFLTQDGSTPGEISSIAREQVRKYDSINFHDGFAVKAARTNEGFEIVTAAGEAFSADKLILATGVEDIMPDIDGFPECWGISVLHCPYCHGYEVRDQVTGILGNGEYAFEFSKLILNWTKKLTLFTNGSSTLTSEQELQLRGRIVIVEKDVKALEHKGGQIEAVFFNDGTKASVSALYSRPAFRQHSSIYANLGCELTNDGYILTDAFQKTTVPGVFACGDNASRMRSVSNAVATGTVAAAMVNKELSDEQFADYRVEPNSP